MLFRPENSRSTGYSVGEGETNSGKKIPSICAQSCRMPEISVITAGQTSNGRRGMPRLQIAFPEPLRESLRRPCFEWQTKEIRMYKFRFIFRFITSITYTSFLIIYGPWFRLMSRLLFNRCTTYVIATVG